MRGRTQRGPDVLESFKAINHILTVYSHCLAAAASQEVDLPFHLEISPVKKKLHFTDSTSWFQRVLLFLENFIYGPLAVLFTELLWVSSCLLSVACVFVLNIAHVLSLILARAVLLEFSPCVQTSLKNDSSWLPHLSVFHIAPFASACEHPSFPLHMQASYCICWFCLLWV